MCCAGEKYAQIVQVKDESQLVESIRGSEVARPAGGWLTIVMFHVVWHDECVKVMESMKELAPAFPAVRFLSIRADNYGMQTVAQEQYSVQKFPSLILQRGEQQLGRVEGYIHVAKQLIDLIRVHITTDDITAALEVQKSQAGSNSEQLTEEPEGELQWVFDNESCGDYIQV